MRRSAAWAHAIAAWLVAIVLVFAIAFAFKTCKQTRDAAERLEQGAPVEP